MIKWTDKKSTMSVKKRIFKAGDIIPAGILSDDRIAYLQKTGQVQVINNGDKIVTEKVVAKVFDKEIVKEVETVFEEVEEKSKRGRKSKQSDFESRVLENADRVSESGIMGTILGGEDD